MASLRKGVVGDKHTQVSEADPAVRICACVRSTLRLKRSFPYLLVPLNIQPQPNTSNYHIYGISQLAAV